MLRQTPLYSLLAVMFGMSTTVAQDADTAALHLELERSRQLVFNLETPTNHLDSRLSEPLFQMADNLMRLGNYGEAHAALDRAMQVVRINEGLYTRSQIPFVRKKIENFALSRNWDAARNQLDHLLWLHRTKSEQLDQQLVNDFEALSALHLRGVAEDSYDYQSFHLRRAASASWLALTVAENHWGKHDERLAPVIYNLIHQYHLHAAAVQRGGRVAYELRQIAPGSDWVRERVEAVRLYYLTGNQLLGQLQEIYRQAEPANPEALAMANLYLADWQVMFSRNTDALESYELAYQGLEEAGVDSALMDAYFSQPTLLPVAEFHSTLGEAMAARTQESQRPVQLASLAAETLYFNEWSAAFPYVQQPAEFSNGSSPVSNFALFSFNIAGVTEISGWLDGRQEKEVASIQEATIVEPQSPTEDEQEQLLKRLDRLRFRPSLEAGGIPRESNATLVYQIAAE